MVDTTGENGRVKCSLCGGTGFFRRDLPPQHPDFGRPLPCTCMQQKKAEAEVEANRAKQVRRADRAGRQRPHRAAMPPPAKDLTSFSYSMLATFEQCPRRFELRYVQGEQTDTGGDRHHIIGSIVHSTLQAFMCDEPENRNLALLERLLDKYWDPYWSRLRPAREETEQWRLTVWQSLSRFYDAADCKGRPRDLEKHFSFQLDESVTISGSIDRIDNVGERDYELIDYKAIEPPFSKSEALHDLQTVAYYFGAKFLYGEHPPLKISYYFIHQGAVVSVNPSPAEMEEGLDRVRALIRRIHSHKEFPPLRNQFCRNCVEYFKCSATKPQ